MKIHCELRSRDYSNSEAITTHEMEVSMFGANLNNPFPCSELYSFSVVDGCPIHVVYQVSEAIA